MQSAVDDWIELREFPKKRIRLTLHQCLTRILPEEVAIVIRNIIDNSFASAPIDSIIVVTLEVLGKSAKLSVQDEGPGVPIHEANLVFRSLLHSPFCWRGQVRKERIQKADTI